MKNFWPDERLSASKMILCVSWLKCNEIHHHRELVTSPYETEISKSKDAINCPSAIAWNFQVLGSNVHAGNSSSDYTNIACIKIHWLWRQSKMSERATWQTILTAKQITARCVDIIPFCTVWSDVAVSPLLLHTNRKPFMPLFIILYCGAK